MDARLRPPPISKQELVARLRQRWLSLHGMYPHDTKDRCLNCDAFLHPE